MSGLPSWASTEPSTIFDHRMDHRLRMDDDVDPLRRQAEQVMRLDQLEPLVHHRRRIDRDLGAHRPVGMGHRLRRRRRGHLLAASESRNGPPLAVRINLATSSERLPARHWKIALCSLSTGRIVAPRSRGRRRSSARRR